MLLTWERYHCLLWHHKRLKWHQNQVLLFLMSHNILQSNVQTDISLVTFRIKTLNHFAKVLWALHSMEEWQKMKKAQRCAEPLALDCWLWKVFKPTGENDFDCCDPPECAEAAQLSAGEVVCLQSGVSSFSLVFHRVQKCKLSWVHVTGQTAQRANLHSVWRTERLFANSSCSGFTPTDLYYAHFVLGSPFWSFIYELAIESH